ncbi:hypothetical protein CLRAG_18300 [Clostridium ragsdalei P11]|uniref:Uncharacterized protein n=1 Tax=Clostridium ragsdalei P11 TaxID=1353534 RepID=A0A1A6AV48_9CLOT|nr:hypothetical protein CLRAG_18300 [Clostridium ragsdalei P11]
MSGMYCCDDSKYSYIVNSAFIQCFADKLKYIKVNNVKGKVI